MKEPSAEIRNLGIWIRVSTEEQANGESPKHHEARGHDYARTFDWNVKEVYDLAGVSGKTVMEHPECKRMLADIRRGHINGLVFTKLARLARNTKELLEFADKFRECKAHMISLDEKIDTTSAAGRMFYTMIAAMAQWEREETSDRIKSSNKIRAKLGKTLGGAAPFGYMWKEKKLVKNPAEAPIRQLMYEYFIENKRKKGVARLLNEKGYRTRKGAKFTDTTVVRLIQDETAKGVYRANYTYRDGKGKLLLKPEAEWIRTPVDRIVSDELWNQCNALLERKNPNRVGPKPVQLFAGILICGNCDKKMYVFARSPKYICTKCRNKIPIETLNGIFEEQLKQFFLSRERLRSHFENANKGLAEKRELIEAHKKQIEKINGEMRKTYQLFQADQISAEGFGRIYKPLEQQIAALNAELPHLQGELDAHEMRHLSAEDVIVEATNLQRVWPRLGRDEKRRIIESITESIVLHEKDIDVTFSCMPTSEELTKRQRNL